MVVFMKFGKKKLKPLGHLVGPSGLRSGLRSALRAPLRPSGPAGCKASNSTKNTPVLMNTTTGFMFLLEKTSKTVIFGPSFTEYRQEKV